MTGTLRITAAEPVVHGVLRLIWNDDHEDVVDLRGTIAQGAIFEYIREPENFAKVRVATFGHSIYWGEEGSEIVDFGSDRLRELARSKPRSSRAQAESATSGLSTPRSTRPRRTARLP